jgi:hypothetical protein
MIVYDSRFVQIIPTQIFYASRITAESGFIYQFRMSEYKTVRYTSIVLTNNFFKGYITSTLSFYSII